MSEAFTLLIQSAPAAGAMLLVVIYFLRAQDRIITQFQQIITEEKQSQAKMVDYFRTIFEGQREALNLVASHIKSLSELLVTHDKWEREIIYEMIDNQNQIITEKLQAASKAKAAVEKKTQKRQP